MDYCISLSYTSAIAHFTALTPPRRDFWLEFSVALGFIGLALMALQFALTARVNSIEASYGIEIILQFHRYTSFAAFAMVLAHPLNN